jgi:hypothetical protein
MRYRRLDDNGDMTFGNQQADFLRNTPETVAQAVMTRLNLWADEWFLDIEAGTQYVQGALGKYTGQTLEPMIRERILATENVTEIVEFGIQIDPDARKVTIDATINTQFGQVAILEVL